MRPFVIRLVALVAALAAVVMPVAAPAQVVVLDDEVVLQERLPGGGAAPSAIIRGDQRGLNSELSGILQSQPPLLPTRVELPSGATLDVTAYPTMNRRTGLPCIGCRNPCRSFRYTYARPDRGVVSVEGQRCRRPNGRWVAFEADRVIGERPASPGSPTVSGLRRAEQAGRASPPPLPPVRPGDAGGTIAGLDGGAMDGSRMDGTPAPWDPPAGPLQEPTWQDPTSQEPTSQEPGWDDAQDVDPRDVDPRQQDSGDIFAEGPGQPTPQDFGPGGSEGFDDDGDPGAAELPPVTGDAPLVLAPQQPETPSVTAEVPPTEAPAPPPAATEQDPGGQQQAAEQVPDRAAAEQDAAGDVPPVDAAPPRAVETQTARVVMPFGGRQADTEDSIAVETAADPEIVRMLRMLRYLDPETTREPDRQSYDAAIAEFAADERFALPVSNTALREKLETAVDRIAALPSCPATGVTGGFGVCLGAAP